MLIKDYLKTHQLHHKNIASFKKKYNRNPKVKSPLIKELENYFKNTSKSEIRRAWNEVVNKLKQ